MISSNKPAIAGWLDIITGIIWLLFVAFFILIVTGIYVGFGTPGGLIQARLLIIFIAFALPGILAIVGGVFSLRRRTWILALLGSICAVPLGLGTIAIVLLAQSKNAFA